ncbi:hypothetical protein M8J76_008766 [Diaphorina citri]|nr:hypothetical protein M8J76_008766 [Diaphorina citri]
MCSDKTPGTPTGWKTPGDVMKLHRLKIKQKALNARLTGNSTSQSSSKLPSRNITEKTINPFRKCSSTSNLGTAQSSNKRSRADLEEEEVSNDDGGTLFRLLGGKSKSDNIENISSFENILSKISNPAQTVKKQDLSQGFDQVPLDWTLRSKMRFMSRKPFPWNQKLKTCEEASGITGFVRCVDTDPSVTTGASCSNLDTSPNAQFLTTCMFWQHPHLPWLQLFPRSRLKGPTAGGHTELHAILTPTTRGFRHLLRAEDIEFTMPLKKPDSTSSTNTESSTKRKKTSDPTLEPLEQTQMETFSDDEDIEEDRTEDWLKEMGVTSTDIRRIQSTQSDLRMGEEREIDRTPESLIYVQGTEAQALFNFLVNCKSCVATTGYLTGVPPTLISPVCFHSASLQYLQVKDSTVRLEGDIYYSMEVRGPILPHTVQYLCQLLEKSQDSFSLTFASVESTKPFSQIKSEHSQDLPPSCQSKEGTNLLSPRRNASSSIFEQQNLSDCGLRKNLISKFCSQNSIRSYESVKYSDKSYRIV